MKQRKLGASGVDVSAIGLGCMVMPGFYNPGDEAQSIATLHRAAEIGVTFIDTADAYSGGKNEELVGRALAGRRDDYFVATKFGNVRDADGKPAVNGKPDYVAEACDKSLARLGIDVIDLYYQHRIDPDVPIEDTVGAMSRLVEVGKVRHLGLSEAAPETVRRAHAAAAIVALQTEYSLWTRMAEDELLPLCKELGIAYVAYSPLGRGMFGGDITGADSLAEGDRRAEHPRFKDENLNANLKLVEPVRALAREKGCTPAQVALAWVLAKGDHIIPIPGTRTRKHLEENTAAADIDLSAAEVASLDAAIPAGAVEGERYPPGAMKHLHQ